MDQVDNRALTKQLSDHILVLKQIWVWLLKNGFSVLPPRFLQIKLHFFPFKDNDTIIKLFIIAEHELPKNLKTY